LKLKLGLPKPKPTPYNLRMANQTTTKPMGFIKDLKMYVHGILYIIIFIVATLALGSRPKQRGCKGAGQEEARESHHVLPGV
jgi:hypothetical protein